ncbi:MAG: ABC transporter ATP-binding protein [Lachnospiraceae bacterium]|nr:ABC transporter ATP-binding protein [Lachnospiraceae bacterium]
MEILVEMKDICKIYNPGENEVRALDHVNLTIHRGEFVAIIGQSGSGKSTLMNMIGCLDVPTSGSYILSGHDVSKLSDNQLSDIRNSEIGFIFQGFNLIANLTARENVELPLIYRGVSQKERHALSQQALAKVGLANRMTHKPSEMSGGQQQRVAIARAIAQAPPVILADEPTGNLDSASSREILGILKALYKDGRTVILITHDNGIAAQAKRIIRIMDGKIVEDRENPDADLTAKSQPAVRTETRPATAAKPIPAAATQATPATTAKPTPAAVAEPTPAAAAKPIPAAATEAISAAATEAISAAATQAISAVQAETQPADPAHNTEA